MSHAEERPTCQCPQPLQASHGSAHMPVRCLASGASVETVRADPPPPHSATILCIDDDRLVLGVCARVLEARGYRVVMATHGLAGLVLAKKEHPDLILLDILMPGMDGLEVCRQLRVDVKCRTTPIILLTASADAALGEQGTQAGATLVMRKPFSADAIVETVERVLRRRRPSKNLVSHEAVSPNAPGQ